MKPIDYAKASGVAILLLVLNVLFSILVVLFYSLVIAPGQTNEFYNAAALRIAPWCSHTIGTALFFIAGYWFAKRNPLRNGILFAAVFTVLYAIIDSATVGFQGFLSLEFGLSMVAKLLAALCGAFLVVKQRSGIDTSSSKDSPNGGIES
jgi:hypothetical protein